MISPLSQDRCLGSWQRNFIISTLLHQEAPNLALRVLRSPSVPADPALEIDTLLANNLVSEAFKYQRAKGDANLLIRFFEGAMRIQKRDLLLDLSLNEGEVKVFVEFLEKAQIPLSENLHFAYLLHKSDFIDALALVDRLLKAQNLNHFNLAAPKEILSIYHSVMEPTSRKLTYMAYTNPDKFELKNGNASPRPLSSSIIKQKLDPAGGIYQRSVLCTKETSGRDLGKQLPSDLPFIQRSGLGFFSFSQKTQTNNVVYPVVVTNNQRKRPAASLQETESKPITYNELEAPLKRRKFDETQYPKKSIRDYDASVLSRFNDTTKPNFNFTKDQPPTLLELTPKKLIKQVTQLTTPVIQPVSIHRTESPDRNRFTPQSILKSGRASVQRSTTPLSHISRKSFESEERSIRFAIPGGCDTTVEGSSSFIVNSTMSDDSEVKDTSAQNISVASNEEFYSPETSVGNTNLTEQSAAQEKGHEDLSFLAKTPLPRPPIRTDSFSQPTKPVSVQSIVSSTPLPVSSSAKQAKKALSRVVLEASVKKSYISDIFGEASAELTSTSFETSTESSLNSDIIKKLAGRDNTFDETVTSTDFSSQSFLSSSSSFEFQDTKDFNESQLESPNSAKAAINPNQQPTEPSNDSKTSPAVAQLEPKPFTSESVVVSLDSDDDDNEKKKIEVKTATEPKKDHDNSDSDSDEKLGQKLDSSLQDDEEDAYDLDHYDDDDFGEEVEEEEEENYNRSHVSQQVSSQFATTSRPSQAAAADDDVISIGSSSDDNQEGDRLVRFC